mgnify:CR=1 FL=1
MRFSGPVSPQASFPARLNSARARRSVAVAVAVAVEIAVAVTAGGTIDIKATDITFEAEDKLTFKGGAVTLELKSSGAVKIKAPTIKVKKADELKQIMHKSG